MAAAAAAAAATYAADDAADAHQALFDGLNRLTDARSRDRPARQYFMDAYTLFTRLDDAHNRIIALTLYIAARNSTIGTMQRQLLHVEEDPVREFESMTATLPRTGRADPPLFTPPYAAIKQAQDVLIERTKEIVADIRQKEPLLAQIVSAYATDAADRASFSRAMEAARPRLIAVVRTLVSARATYASAADPAAPVGGPARTSMIDQLSRAIDTLGKIINDMGAPGSLVYAPPAAHPRRPVVATRAHSDPSMYAPPSSPPVRDVEVHVHDTSIDSPLVPPVSPEEPVFAAFYTAVAADEDAEAMNEAADDAAEAAEAAEAAAAAAAAVAAEQRPPPRKKGRADALDGAVERMRVSKGQVAQRKHSGWWSVVADGAELCCMNA